MDTQSYNYRGVGNWSQRGDIPLSSPLYDTLLYESLGQFFLHIPGGKSWHTVYIELKLNSQCIIPEKLLPWTIRQEDAYFFPSDSVSSV